MINTHPTVGVLSQRGLVQSPTVSISNFPSVLVDFSVVLQCSYAQMHNSFVFSTIVADGQHTVQLNVVIFRHWSLDQNQGAKKKNFILAPGYYKTIYTIGMLQGSNRQHFSYSTMYQTSLSLGRLVVNLREEKWGLALPHQSLFLWIKCCHKRVLELQRAVELCFHCFVWRNPFIPKQH